MVSLEAVKMPTPCQAESGSSPRISFSAEFLDESDFISINPTGERGEEAGTGKEKLARNPADPNFEFLSDNVGGHAKMLTADKLFFEGKLLPFWTMQQTEKLDRINLKSGEEEEGVEEGGGGEAVGRISNEPRGAAAAAALAPPMGISWSFIDDDPSPRPPKCTVLWKELLRLKKHQRPNFSSSSLSPSSSSSSTSSSSSSMADAAAADEKKKKKKKTATKTGDGHENNDVKGDVKRVKKGLERTRSTTIRIRPMVNVPICTPVSRGGGGGGAALPPLFPLKKGRV